MARVKPEAQPGDVLIEAGQYHAHELVMRAGFARTIPAAKCMLDERLVEFCEPYCRWWPDMTYNTPLTAGQRWTLHPCDKEKKRTAPGVTLFVTEAVKVKRRKIESEPNAGLRALEVK